MVERVHDRDARVVLRLVLHPLHPLLQVRRVLIAGENGDLPLAAHLLRQLLHHLLSHLLVVAAVERKAVRPRDIAVERHHRHPALHGFVHRAHELVRVARREKNRVRAAIHRVGDPLRLDRSVFVRWREPVDFHIDAGRLRELRRRRIGTRAPREKHRIRRALRDHRDRERLSTARCRAAGRGLRRSAFLGSAARQRGQRRRGGDESRDRRSRAAHEVSSVRRGGEAGSVSLAGAAASRLANKRVPLWSSTTARIIALPMMIHS